MSFDPSYRELRSLLNEDIIFKVPRYQRSYVWTKDEWENLNEDIILAMEKNKRLQNSADSSKKSKHFIGSFIFETKDKEWEIIDGQQRLSTITLILVTIAKIMRDLGKDDYSNAFQKYIFFTDSRDQRTNKIDNQSKIFSLIIAKYYKSDELITNIHEFIESEGVICKKEERNFIDCVFFYQNEIQSKILNFENNLNKIEYLEKLRDTVLDLESIQIVAKNKNDGYVIFQVLNSRGKPLATHELLKNYIFTYERDVDGSDTASIKWSSIIDNTELENTPNASLDKYITNFITHRFGKTEKKKEFDVILKNVKKHEVGMLLSELYDKSKIYKKICKQEGYTEKINYVLNFLNRIKNTQFRPVLLSLFDANAKGKLNIDELEKSLISIKNFLSVYTVVFKAKTNKLERIIYKYSQELNLSFSKNKLKDFFNELYTQIQSRTEFTERFTKLAFSKDKNWYSGINTNFKKEIQHILTEYEIYVTTDDFVVPKPFTLEHIKDDSTLGSACYIGNIIPLSSKLNKKCIGKSITEKIDIYKTANYSITKKIAERLENNIIQYGNPWTDNNISKRSEIMANEFYDVIWTNQIK